MGVAGVQDAGHVTLVHGGEQPIRRGPVVVAETPTSEQWLLEALRSAADILGTTPSVKEYGRLRAEGLIEGPTVATIISQLGWARACTLAGLSPNRRPACFGLPTFSEHDHRAALRRVAHALGHPPSLREYSRHRRELEPSAAAIRSRYSGWRAARAHLIGEEPLPEVLSSGGPACAEPPTWLSGARSSLPAQRTGKNLADRDAAIMAARVEGATVVEIARRFGLSKQRVSQILVSRGRENLTAVSRKVRSARHRAGASARRGEVLTAWRAGTEERVIADGLGLKRSAVRELLRTQVSAADRAARRHARLEGKRDRTFSDQDLVDAIRAAVERSGRVISRPEYAGIAKALDLASCSTIESRLGSWNAAIRAAGFRPRNTPARLHARRWTEETCVAALRTLVAERGELPSTGRYRELARGRKDLPSLSTVGNRVGHWSALALRLTSESADS